MFGVQSLLCIGVFVIAFTNSGICVKINNLQVPEVIRHGSPVVLDCDFSLEPLGDDELVVKWYKNKTLVYQWIPARRPVGLGILKGRLNLAYAASEQNYSVHRALHILKSGPDLSGEYTCSVSTLKNEDERTKTMLVFVPEKSLILKRMRSEQGVMKVQCTAEGVFPQPSIILRSRQREIAETEVKVREKGQLFDITASAVLPALQDPEEFSCEVRIPEANYTKRQETVFFPGSENVASSYELTSPTIYVHLMWIYVILNLC